MKEDFLHYLWRFSKFRSLGLQTTSNESLTIIHPGQYLQLAGPDFFDARIIIGTQKWAGTIEIHLKSSDWYLHNHHDDVNYENVILHVVWEHDIGIFRKDNTEIPVLELKHYTEPESLDNYLALMSPKSWIFCENDIAAIDGFLLRNWQERLFFERLSRKAAPIQLLCNEMWNDWEAVLFCTLAKNFGLNTNGEAFLAAARKIPFSVFMKERDNLLHLESLLLGMCGLLDGLKEDVYFRELRNAFEFLTHKYQLDPPPSPAVEFFKHRPDNFPTIRLAQFAALYHRHANLFSMVVKAKTPAEHYSFFKVGVSAYWQMHYQFDRPSPFKRKILSESFIDLIILNTILPLKFEYYRAMGTDFSEELVALASALKPETNAVTEKFAHCGIHSTNALESQSLLQLKNDYCAKGRCLSCAIGISLLKDSGMQKSRNFEDQ